MKYGWETVKRKTGSRISGRQETGNGWFCILAVTLSKGPCLLSFLEGRWSGIRTSDLSLVWPVYWRVLYSRRHMGAGQQSDTGTSKRQKILKSWSYTHKPPGYRERDVGSETTWLRGIKEIASLHAQKTKTWYPRGLAPYYGPGDWWERDIRP